MPHMDAHCYALRRRCARMLKPDRRSSDAEAGSGTLDVGKGNPLATAKASKAATSPAVVVPL